MMADQTGTIDFAALNALPPMPVMVFEAAETSCPAAGQTIPDQGSSTIARPCPLAPRAGWQGRYLFYVPRRYGHDRPTIADTLGAFHQEGQIYDLFLLEVRPGSSHEQAARECGDALDAAAAAAGPVPEKIHRSSPARRAWRLRLLDTTSACPCSGQGILAAVFPGVDRFPASLSLHHGCGDRDGAGRPGGRQRRRAGRPDTDPGADREAR